MILFIRKIKDYYWEVEDKQQLCGEAITIDLKAEKNEWSVFKVDVNEVELTNSSIEKVILYLFLKFPKKPDFDGISIALFDQETLRRFYINMPEGSQKMENDVVHMNIKGINYVELHSGMDMLIDIVNNQENRILNYSVKDIYNIIQKNSDYFSQEYKQFSKNIKDIINKIFKKYGFNPSNYELKS